MEIIRRAESRGILASIKCSLDSSQLPVCSVVKEERRTRKHIQNCGHARSKPGSKGGARSGISHIPAVLKLH